jgi:hypothetical protein
LVTLFPLFAVAKGELGSLALPAFEAEALSALVEFPAVAAGSEAAAVPFAAAAALPVTAFAFVPS